MYEEPQELTPYEHIVQIRAEYGIGDAGQNVNKQVSRNLHRANPSHPAHTASNQWSKTDDDRPPTKKAGVDDADCLIPWMQKAALFGQIGFILVELSNNYFGWLRSIPTI